jgi:hypothetical protein
MLFSGFETIKSPPKRLAEHVIQSPRFDGPPHSAQRSRALMRPWFAALAA